MTKRKAGINKLYLFIFILGWYIILSNCYTPPIRKIPVFHYQKLLERHQRLKSDEPFPIIVQPSEEEDFSVTTDGYMVYSSEEEGNFDLWLRDLNSILRIRLIQHPAKQYQPYIKKLNSKTYVLVYVSNDSDIQGDIYINQINPEQIFDVYINKREKINYWNFSLNLSRYIEKQFESHSNTFCKGKFSELFPVVEETGRFIYFISDRCFQKFYLWRIAIKDGKPIGKPEVVLKKEMYYLSITNHILTFNLIQNHNIQSQFGIYNLKTKELKIIRPNASGTILPGLAIKPKISQDLRTIFFLYIEKDTNQNGTLDPFDRNGLFKCNTKGNVDSQIIEDNHTISHYDTSNYLGGSIFYTSNVYSQKDIFLSHPQGMIPKKNSPYEQYEYAQSLQSFRNYFLSLQSVISYFRSDPKFLTIEGEVLYDIIQYLKENHQKPKLEFYLSYKKKREKENPYFNLFYTIRQQEIKNQFSIRSLKPYTSIIHNMKQKEKDYLYYRLGQLLWKKNPHQSRQYFQKISSKSIFRKKASYYLFLYDFLYSRNPWSEIYLTQAIQNKKNLIKIFNIISRKLEKQSIKNLQKLLQKNHLNILKPYISFHISKKLFIQQKWEESLKVLNSIYQYTKDTNSPYTRFLKLQVLKLKISIYKKLNREREVLNARNEFIYSYDKDLQVELEEEELEGLIQASNRFVKKFRKSAKSIYKTIQDKIGNSFVGSLTNQLVAISIIDRDNLKEFCAPDSIAGKLIDDYNYLEYEQRYAQLCKNLKPYLQNNQNQIPIELAFESNQLMYLSSYAYANLINILFFNVHSSGIFENYYKKWSIYYHRLKVDLAIERFRYLLDWQEKRALLLTQEEITNLLIEKDPFDGKIFNDLLYGYREVAWKSAQETFEYSILYGHAYTLIKKSIEREKFYDSLFLKGFSISNAELIKRKRNILLELKEAEYQLQYILTLEPENEDAALLLTYLYSYLDYRKEKAILNPPGLIDRFLQFLTGLKPKRLTDGIFYRSLYRSTFPERLYEKNISILENTLSIRQKKGYSVSKSLYLSLANNYYKLFNYKKAIFYYKKLENNKQILENPQQKILYHFYYGKANFHENHYNQAIQQLEISYRILYERYKLKLNEYNILKAKIIKQKSFRLFPLEKNEEEKSFQRISQEISQMQIQLATILILQSLSKYYSQEFQQAIIDLESALRFLKNNESIKIYNIYNFIALYHLKNNNYEKAIDFAYKAIQQVKQSGIRRNDEYFIPQTVGGRLLGLFLNFNEDFSVIGEGKIPHEISSLRSYEISKGILQNSYKNLGDFQSLLQSIQEKKEIIKKYDFDVHLGKEAYLSLLNQEAIFYYQVRRYDKAFSLFKESSELAYKFNFTDDYYQNFKNMFYVIFESIEQEKQPHSKEIRIQFIQTLLYLKEELENFKERYFTIRKEEFIKSKKVENPDYSINPKDLNRLKQQIESELKEFYHLEALLFYYMFRFNQNDKEWKTALTKIKQILDTYQKSNVSIDRFYYRIYINYFKILLQNPQKMAHPYEILKELEDIRIEMLNYDLPLEQIEILQLIGDYYLFQNNYLLASNFYEKAINLIDKNHIFISEISKFHPIFHKYIFCLWKSGKPEKIILLREKYRFLILHHLFFSKKLLFRNSDITKLFSEIVDSITQIRNLKRYQISERFKNKDTRKITNQIKKIQNRIQAYKKELLQYLPEFKDYLFFDTNLLKHINPNNQYIHLLQIDPKNHICISIYNRKVRIQNLKTTKDIQKCIFRTKEVILIPGKHVYFTHLKKIFQFLNKNHTVVLRSSMIEPYPVVLKSPKDLQHYNKNIFNRNPSFILPEQNIKHLHPLPIYYIFSTSQWGLGIYLKEKPTFSTVILKSQPISFFISEKSQSVFYQYESTWIMYDILSRLGISYFFDLYHYPWGIRNYHESSFKKYQYRLAQKYFQKGLEQYRHNPHKALKYFSLSFSLRKNIKTQIYILGALIRTNNPDAQLYQKQLKEKIKHLQSYRDLYQFYIIILNSYLYIKKYQPISEIILDIEKDFPESRKVKVIKSSLFIIQELLKTNPDLQQIAYMIQNQQYHPSFLRRMIEGLYQHGSYRLAHRLSRRYKQLLDLNIKSKISMILIHTERIPENLTKNLKKELYKTKNDISLLYIRKIINKKFDYIIDDIKNSEFPGKTRIYLYEILKNQYTNTGFHLEKLICNQDQEFNCKDFNDIEKKLFFHYLLMAIPYDVYNITDINLSYLLDEFFQNSCTMGNLYLSRVISAYVRNFEYHKAFDFYQKYKHYNSCLWNWDELELHIDKIAFPLFILRALQYKISDPLILEFRKRNPHLSIIVDDFTKILFEPKKQLPQLISRLHWNLYPKSYHKNVYDIFLHRAIKEKDWILFQNIAFLKDAQIQKYRDQIHKIFNHLNQTEEWFNIIEYKMKFYQCRVKIKQCKQLPINASTLRKQLYRYFYESQHYKEKTISVETLLDLYSKIYINNTLYKNYIWLNHIHKLSPMIYKDNTFFVWNVHSFRFQRKKFIMNHLYSIQEKESHIPKKYRKKLSLILEFKNSFSRKGKTIYLSTKNYTHTLYIQYLKQSRLKYPILDLEKFTIPINIYKGQGIFFLYKNNPYSLFLFLNHFYIPIEISMEKRLHQLYKKKTLYEEYYFIKPYTQNLLY